MVKAVIDLERKTIGIGGFLHSDIEEALLADGSKQESLWGINVYPWNDQKERIDYTAMINIRPRQGNFSIEIADEQIKKEIRALFETLVLAADESVV
jgi:hypothetical protein